MFEKVHGFVLYRKEHNGNISLVREESGQIKVWPTFERARGYTAHCPGHYPALGFEIREEDLYQQERDGVKALIVIE